MKTLIKPFAISWYVAVFSLPYGLVGLGIFLCSFGIPKPAVKKEVFTVVIDAGHGGHDPGKVSNAYKEKDIALKIALLVGEELEKQPGIKVVYTRKTDVFVDLFKRGQIANKANADLFISVHCNAHHTEASGSETYVLGLHANKQNFEVAKAENEVIYLEKNYEVNYSEYNINSPESIIGLTIMQEEFLDHSILLAKAIQDNFTNTLKRKNRGVKQAGFIVLHQTFMPSVLIETGFITNSDERKYLLSAKGQQEIASGIVNAVFTYKKLIEENVGDDLSYETSSSAPVADSAVASSPEVIFKVQIAASSRKIAPKSYNFKGLQPIRMEEGDKLYRYLYGEAGTYGEAEKLKKEAVKKGYTSSFIVAYKNGKKIALSAALQKPTQ